MSVLAKVFTYWVVIMIGVQSQAQYQAEFPYKTDLDNFDLHQSISYDTNLVRRAHIKEIETYAEGEGQKILSRMSFDTLSMLESAIVYKYSFGEARRRVLYSNLSSQKYPDNVCLGKGDREIRKNNYIYIEFDDQKLLSGHDFYRRGKIDTRITFEFNSGLILNSCYFKKNMEIPLKKWTYEYYPDHTRKSSILYQKGKIKYVWNYECKEEGELAKEHKDTTDVCRIEDVDKDGNRTITSRRFDEKGRPTKVQFTYDKRGVFLSYKTFNSRDILTYSHTQTPDYLKWVLCFYNEKGKESVKKEKNFNQSGKLISSMEYRGGKLVTQTEYLYDDQNLLIFTATVDRNKRLKETEKFTYDEHDVPILIQRFNKNEKLIRGRSFKYIYY